MGKATAHDAGRQGDEGVNTKATRRYLLDQQVLKSRPRRPSDQLGKPGFALRLSRLQHTDIHHPSNAKLDRHHFIYCSFQQLYARMIDCFFAALHPVVDPTAVRSGSVVPRAAGAVLSTRWFARSRSEVKWKLAMVEHEADRWIILLGEGNDPEVAMRELENMGEPGAWPAF